jgi:hypothetical protein
MNHQKKVIHLVSLSILYTCFVSERNTGALFDTSRSFVIGTAKRKGRARDKSCKTPGDRKAKRKKKGGE